jgi:cellobiose phosphorylase
MTNETNTPEIVSVAALDRRRRAVIAAIAAANEEIADAADEANEARELLGTAIDAGETTYDGLPTMEECIKRMRNCAKINEKAVARRDAYNAELVELKAKLRAATE